MTTDASRVARPRKRKVRLGRTLMIGAISQLVLLAVGVVIAFATDWTGFSQWIAAPVLGMVASLIDVFKQAGADVPDSDHRSSRASRDDRRRTPLAVGLLVTVALIGGGGWALATGVGYVTGLVTGNESGFERLEVGPVVADNAGVVATVEGVEQTAHYTRVTIVVKNGLSTSLNLPVFSNCSLSDANGITLDADSFRSSWNPSIAAGSSRRGVLVFSGQFPDEPVAVTLTFSTVFVHGFDGPSSLAIPNIQLRAVGN